MTDHPDPYPVTGSDVIVQMLKDAGIRHVAFNPGASFRGIHDSLVNVTGSPQIVLALHESIAVGVAQGYVKACGQPMVVLLHNVVGLQNGAMAIYNAWRDRAPMLIVGGTGPKAISSRRPWIDWVHTASVQGNLVRDFVVWDNEPHDLASVPEALARGLRAASSLPGGPVYLCIDVDMQEDPVPTDFAPWTPDLLKQPTQPAVNRTSVSMVAERIRDARLPLFVAGFVGETDDDFATLVELAELVGAAVIDSGVRHAFPTEHSLCATGIPEIWDNADLIVLLDVDNIPRQALERPEKIVDVGVGSLRMRSWAQDYQPLHSGDLIIGNPNSFVSDLVVSFRDQPIASDKVQNRVELISELTGKARHHWRESAGNSTATGAVPLDRLVFEVGKALGDRPFILANGTNGRLEHRTWPLNHPRQYLGWHSGGGLGYGLPASIGAALATDYSKIIVDIQADGDLLFLPSALWTAAHYETPVLIVVNNNRQYGNTVEHAAKISQSRRGNSDGRYEGAAITEPTVDFSKLAHSFGVWAIGPVVDAESLATVLAEAIAVVEMGKPALVDVWTPGF